MPPSATPVHRTINEGIILAVRLTPKSSIDAIEGVGAQGNNQFIKARVRALPEKGRANAALEQLVSGWLGVPRSRVRVERGGKSRLKSVAISGDANDLQEKLKQAIGNDPNE